MSDRKFSMIPSHPAGTARVFTLHGQNYKVGLENLSFPGAVVLTPEAIPTYVVLNAWTYAVRYSAKGLDHPDYEGALNLMLQRHPSWQIIDRACVGIQFDLKNAGEDIPEN